MRTEKLYKMKFSELYPLYVNKITRKGKDQKDLDTLILWMSAYSQSELEKFKQDSTTLEEFFTYPHHANEQRFKVTGVICGVRVEEVEDRILKEIRIMDKIVDELAKGKKLEKIMREDKA